MSKNDEPPSSTLAGLKSYLTLVVSGVVVPYLVTRSPVPLTPDMQVSLSAALVAGVGMVMRTVSKGPPLHGLRALLFRRKASASEIPSEVIVELARRAAPLLAAVVERAIERRLVELSQSKTEVPKEASK